MQYRIPTLNEFKDGFEFEILLGLELNISNTGSHGYYSWVKVKVTEHSFTNQEFIEKLLDTNNVRVKN